LIEALNKFCLYTQRRWLLECTACFTDWRTTHCIHTLSTAPVLTFRRNIAACSVSQSLKNDLAEMKTRKLSEVKPLMCAEPHRESGEPVRAEKIIAKVHQTRARTAKARAALAFYRAQDHAYGEILPENKLTFLCRMKMAQRWQAQPQRSSGATSETEVVVVGGGALASLSSAEAVAMDEVENNEGSMEAAAISPLRRSGRKRSLPARYRQ
jgi:hypothetical protein